MNKLKELNERLGAKKKEARDLIAAADTAKRDLTAEERTKISALQNECEGITEQVHIEARQLALEAGKAPRLSEQEKRDLGRFDYSKLLNHLERSLKGTPSTLDGVEAEMLQEGEKEARTAGIRTSGLMLPRILVRGAEKRDMTATGTTSVTLDQGGMTIATAKAGLLDDFFNASVMRQAGATVLEGLVGNLDIPRLVAGTAASGKA